MSDLPAKKVAKEIVKKAVKAPKKQAVASETSKKTITPKKVTEPKSTTPKVSKKVVVSKDAEARPSVVTPETVSPEVVVLPQSHNKVFLIWRAEPVLDESTDSWIIRSSFGELARVPARSRSVFLTGSGKFNVDIYRVSKEGSEELFVSHGVDVQGYRETSSPQSFSRLNSSSVNFRRRISS